MLYQQIITIGEGGVPAVIDYTVEDSYCIVQRVSVRKTGDDKGPFDQDVTAMFDGNALDSMGERLDRNYYDVIRELDFLHGESVAADRAAFQEAYA